MKKLFSLLLCLVMLLPVLALAETATEPTLYTIPFDGFTLTLTEHDAYQAAEAKLHNQIYVQVYPNYDPEVLDPDTFNIAWYNGNGAAELAAFAPLAYAQLILNSTNAQLVLYGIEVIKSEVLEAAFEDNTYTALTYSELDYSGMGIDMVIPNYQLNMYFCLSETDTYIVSLRSTTMEGLEAMLPYIDSIEFN